MRVTLAPGITITVLSSGDAEIVQEKAGHNVRSCWGPARTAMWIALRQNNGDIEAASAHLAKLWENDPANIGADMALWIDGLQAAGLIDLHSSEPEPGPKLPPEENQGHQARH